MEKKQYINPEIEVVKIATQQMLASSPDGTGKVDTSSDPQDPGGFEGHGDEFDW